MNNKKEKKVNDKERFGQISKIVILCIVGCVLMGIMLAIYQNNIPDILAEYEADGKMEHTAWLVEYGSLVPPVIILAIIITAAYSDGSVYIPVRTQYDKAIIVGVTFAFTYLVLFVSSLLSSPEWTHTDDVSSAFEICAPWFFAQLVPFLLLFSYHIIRASSEKKELCENEE